MDRRNVVIGGINTSDFNVFVDTTPDITLPKTDYKMLTIPGRLIPQFQKVPEEQTGSLPLVLNGLFKSNQERIDFEDQVIHRLSNEAVHIVELGSGVGTMHYCTLGNQIKISELFEDELIIKYTIDLTIVKTIKK